MEKQNCKPLSAKNIASLFYGKTKLQASRGKKYCSTFVRKIELQHFYLEKHVDDDDDDDDDDTSLSKNENEAHLWVKNYCSKKNCTNSVNSNKMATALQQQNKVATLLSAKIELQQLYCQIN